MKRALYLPGPSYFDKRLAETAGWTRILEYQKEAIERAGYEVTVAAPVPGVYQDAPPFAKYLTYCLPYLDALIGVANFDLIVGSPSYGALPLLQKTAARKAAFVWNNAPWWRRYMLEDEYRRFGIPYAESEASEALTTAALRSCDLVIACSPHVKKTHEQIGGLPPVKIAHWGVDSARFSPADDQAPLLDAPLRILFLGADPVRKGLSYLLRAVDGLAGVAITVAACAPGWAAPGGPVTEIGPVPWDLVPSLMRRHHVICIPTLEDGIALAVQEAMASGLVPVTSPDAGEVFENVMDGFVVGFRDVAGLRNGLCYLRDHPGERAAMAGRALAKARTQTWEVFIQEFSQHIKELESA